MNRKNFIVWIAAIGALVSVSLLGAYALQAHQLERELAALPLVSLDPIVIAADRAQPAKASTQLARTQATTTLR
jgi:hypothetical protein